MSEQLSEYIRIHCDVWDALWARKSIGRIAVAVTPSADLLDASAEVAAGLITDEPDEKPAGWDARWREALSSEVRRIVAALSLPGDAFPAMTPPRFVHGQSQGICDLFGARPELQPDGNVFVHPLPPDPKIIDAVDLLPIEKSMYWGAVEWIRYARGCTRGLFGFRSPIMTGPFDTANYLLGTTTLLEWVYAEPETLHRLLVKITDVICAMLSALKNAAGGMLSSPHHFSCVRGGYDFASECRSLVSREIYETFEAPYLRRIGERHGPFAIHSCGSWERTVPSALADPNFRAMHGQIRENDLQTPICQKAPAPPG